MKSANSMIRVWDPAVRIGHWTLVLAFFTAYFTEDDLLTQHVWAGYAVGAVVCFRLVWGFIGTRHARFTDFVRAPRTVLRDLAGILARHPHRHIGHNPAGGAMIIALLAGLAGTVYSGLMVYAIEEGAGPLAAWVIPAPGADAALGRSPSAEAEAEEDHRRGAGGMDRREEFWEEVHELLANLVLLMVGLHLAGVLLGSYAHHENLIGAMFTGRKRPEMD